MRSTDLLRRLWGQNRSETHLTITLEHSEQEHRVSLAFITQLCAFLSVLQRSQTPNAQSNRRSLIRRVKDSLASKRTRQSHDPSGLLSTVNPREDDSRSFIDRAKDLFKPKALQSHDSSAPLLTVHPREDVGFVRADKVCAVRSFKSLQRINPDTGCCSEF
jgi:hypothetical protein